jgi:hypothetical protein
MRIFKKVVVTNVKVLLKAPEGVFDIVYPRGARVFNELLHETITVGAPKSPSGIGKVLGQPEASGSKVAEAADKRAAAEEGAR